MRISRFVTASLLGWCLVGALAAAPQIAPGPLPVPRERPLLAYDASRNTTVLASGANQWPNTLTDSWERVGTSPWVASPNPVMPSMRGRAIYDRARSEVFAYGETPQGVRQTWTRRQGVWGQRSPSVQPNTAAGFGLTYDPLRQRVVLFGGGNCCSYGLDETWEWDGSDWTLMNPTNKPAPRLDCQLAFDPVSNRVILYGGVNAVVGGYGDTWAWDGNDWTQLQPQTSPPHLEAYAMTTMWSTGKVVMFGGLVPFGGGWQADTWEWDGNNWAQKQTAQSPPTNIRGRMAHDDARGEVLLFGGATSERHRTSDLWIYDGNDWRMERHYQRSPINGNLYALTPPMTWAAAEALAVQEGGHLATVRNQQEQNWLEQAFGQGHLWIGLSDAAQEGAFVWASGEPVTFTNWAPNQPDNANGVEHYVHLAYSHAGQWNDRSTGYRFSGILEISEPAASVVNIGPGCAGSSTGVPLLGTTSSPVLGQSMQLTVTNAPPATQGALFFSATVANFNLAPFGAPNCTLYANNHVAVSFTTDFNGTWFNPPTITIPNSLSLLGGQFWNQALLIDIGSPPLFVITSNGTEATIGF